jgi:Tol biopolymer transport system component
MTTAGRAFRQAPFLLALLSSLALGLAQQGRIAFIDPSGRLATVAPDGSELRVLTEPGRLFQFPAWSPDGTMLAAIGADAEGGAVYIVTDSVGAVPQELYRSQAEPPFYLYWTPSGRHLGFLANHPSGIGLHIASPQEAESRLRLTGQPFYWQWSADGQELLVHTGFAGPGSRLAFIDAGGEGFGDNLAAPGFFQAPGISASERYIAYSAADVLGGGRLVVQAHPHLDPSEGEAARIEVRHQGLVALGWSPTADLLAFTSPPVPAPFPYGPIFLLDAETGGLELLVTEVAIAFFWSPDGCCIAYFTPVLGGGE